MKPYLDYAVTLVPPHRCSTETEIEVRVCTPKAVSTRWSIVGNAGTLQSGTVCRNDTEAYESVRVRIEQPGEYRICFEFADDQGINLGRHSQPYDVVGTGVRSTRRIDGCWISLVHWSESEARHFNTDLKKLTHNDWLDQIRAMNEVGIKSILIQNMFDSNAYAGNHRMTADNYVGKAFYPSELFPGRYPLACDDPCEAILQAADECGMTVFMGVGLFAWFDYSAESLEWHRRVTQELFNRYGHHPSLYAWYLSEEMFGALYSDEEFLPKEAYRDIVRFFHDYRAFVQSLTPTKPVAMAPNNIQFHEHAEEWGEILPNLDILIPFAFARDPEHMNIAEIQAICDQAGTRFWVDMEMFAFPFDHGLKPKTIDELEHEIRTYDAVEQIFGYQFTGIMNHPDSQYNLGGEPAKQLYRDYLAYINRP